jgi:hypothetical protein
MRDLGHLKDFHARVTRINEAFKDGDLEFVAIALPDLVDDLWKVVKRLQSRHCPRCGLICRWPGELADHLSRVHAEAA